MRDFKVGDEVATASGIVSTVTEVLGDTVHVIYQDGSATSWRKEALTLVSKGREAVSHPQHYGGDAPYEVIKVAEAWDFDKDAYLFNVLKYIARHESKGNPLEDLKKALWYLERKIARMEDALG